MYEQAILLTRKINIEIDKTTRSTRLEETTE